MCQGKQSAQRLIYSIYELIAVIEMEGIIMMTHAYKNLLDSTYWHENSLIE